MEATTFTDSCVLCGRSDSRLGAITPEGLLCHSDDHHPYTCYHLWTVYKVRDMADAQRIRARS